MNLYRIMRNNFLGWDIYTGAVVAAESEDDARHIHPNKRIDYDWVADPLDFGDWIAPEHVRVEYIGETHLERGVVLASFKAG